MANDIIYPTAAAIAARDALYAQNAATQSYGYYSDGNGNLYSNNRNSDGSLATYTGQSAAQQQAQAQALAQQQQQAQVLVQQQAQMQAQQAAYTAQVAQQAAAAKKLALDQAWGSNSQALNSQKSTVDNNYTSSANKLNALQASRLPEFQQQKNAASAEAAQIARRNTELMAATGRGDSGYNRSNQLATDLNRSNAISSLTSNENQFKTDVGNQLSDVDNQRVAALNDIAEKLTLGQQQYNEGSLSLTNQLQSEISTGALKAMMDAQTWADNKGQQNLDNSFRQAQFDQSTRLAQLQQDWQEKQFRADQEAQAFNQSLQQGQLLGTFNGTSTLAAQAQAAEQAYRQAALEAETTYKNASLAASREKSNTPTVAQQKANISADAYDEINNQLSRGNSPEAIIQSISSQRGDLIRQGIDPDELIKYVQANSGKVTSKENASGDIISTLGSYIPLDGSLESLRRLGGGSI